MGMTKKQKNIIENLQSSEGRASLAQAMVEPIKISIEYGMVGRKIEERMIEFSMKELFLGNEIKNKELFIKCINIIIERGRLDELVANIKEKNLELLEEVYDVVKDIDNKEIKDKIV